MNHLILNHRVMRSCSPNSRNCYSGAVGFVHYAVIRRYAGELGLFRHAYLRPTPIASPRFLVLSALAFIETILDETCAYCRQKLRHLPNVRSAESRRYWRRACSFWVTPHQLSAGLFFLRNARICFSAGKGKRCCKWDYLGAPVEQAVADL